MSEQIDTIDQLDALFCKVYMHGVREGNNPGSRMDITALPDDELTIATALSEAHKLLKSLLTRRKLEGAVVEAARNFSYKYNIENSDLAKKLRESLDALDQEERG